MFRRIAVPLAIGTIAAVQVTPIDRMEAQEVASDARRDAGQESEGRGVVSVNTIRACLDSTSLPKKECKLIRRYYIRGVVDTWLILSGSMGEVLSGDEDWRVLYTAYSSKCLLEAPFTQIMAMYEKYEAEHPEEWGDPAIVMFRKAVVDPLCERLGERFNRDAGEVPPSGKK